MMRPPSPAFPRRQALRSGALALSLILLAGCGGGGGGDSSPPGTPTAANPPGTPTAANPPAAPAAPPMTQRDAVRLAAQASFGRERGHGHADAHAERRRLGAGPAAIAAGLALHGRRHERRAHRHQWRGLLRPARQQGDQCWRDAFSSQPLLWDFYRNAVGQPDQLRQRVAFALQQILVVSNLEVEGTYGLRRYQNTLLEHAFGNYRDVLRAVALSPVMATT